MEYEIKGPLEMACNVSKTVVPIVLSRLDFWCFFCLHLLLHILFKLGYMHENFAIMTLKDMGMITAMTTFFEVFYTGECFRRYLDLYGHVQGCFSHAYNFVFLTRFHFRPKGQPYDRLAAQWLVGAVILSLFEAREKRPMHAADLQKLLSLGLIRPHEMAFLRNVNGYHRSMVMMHMAGDFVRMGAVVSEAPPYALRDSIDLLDELVAIHQEMHDLISFPLPFGYVHFLSVMVTLNMSLWAYAIATQQSMFGPVFYFMACLIFVGMMDLASQLSDPFGDDDADFPIKKWMHEFLLNMSALIEYEHDGTSDGFEPDLREEEYQSTDFKLGLRQIEMLMDEQHEESSYARSEYRTPRTPRSPLETARTSGTRTSGVRQLTVYDMPYW